MEGEFKNPIKSTIIVSIPENKMDILYIGNEINKEKKKILSQLNKVLGNFDISKYLTN